MVAFVGESVTARHMLDRWESGIDKVIEPEGALHLLEGYVRWAATQKLGSVFDAMYDSNGMLVARKVADSLPTRGKLPEGCAGARDRQSTGGH